MSDIPTEPPVKEDLTQEDLPPSTPPSEDPPAEATALRYCLTCPMRLPALKFDAHTLCNKCRGQVCSDSNKCDECVLWGEDFFSVYAKHTAALATRRRYKAKIKKSKSEEAGPSGSVDEGVGPSVLSSSPSQSGEGDKAPENVVKVPDVPPGFPTTPPAPPGFNQPPPWFESFLVQFNASQSIFQKEFESLKAKVASVEHGHSTLPTESEVVLKKSKVSPSEEAVSVTKIDAPPVEPGPVSLSLELENNIIVDVSVDTVPVKDIIPKSTPQKSMFDFLDPVDILDDVFDNSNVNNDSVLNNFNVNQNVNVPSVHL